MYTEFYNLRGSPFRLNPDHRFFYVAEPHEKAIAHLKYALNRNEGFVVITGEVGAGKTTLVNRMLHDLEESRYITGTIVTSFIEHDDLVPLVAATFGVDQGAGNKASLLLNIRAFLEEQRVLGRRPILFVDEVQNLPESSLEELRMLSNFSLPGESLLQIFLVGQPEFRETLADESLEQLRQRVVTSCHLGTLHAEDTRSYVHHRLNLANWNGDPEFSDRAFELIHRLSGGVPRRINVICDRLLLHGFLEQLHRIDAAVLAAVARDMTDEGLLTAPADVLDPDAPATTADPEAHREEDVHLEEEVHREEKAGRGDQAAAAEDIPEEAPNAAVLDEAKEERGDHSGDQTPTLNGAAETDGDAIGLDAVNPDAVGLEAVEASGKEDPETETGTKDARDREAVDRQSAQIDREAVPGGTLQAAGHAERELETGMDPTKTPSKETDEAAAAGEVIAFRRRPVMARYALAAAVVLAVVALPEGSLLRWSTAVQKDAPQLLFGSEETSVVVDPLDAPDAKTLTVSLSDDKPVLDESLLLPASNAPRDKLNVDEAKPAKSGSGGIEIASVSSQAQTLENGVEASEERREPESLLKPGLSNDTLTAGSLVVDRFLIQLAALRATEEATRLQNLFKERFQEQLAGLNLGVRRADIAGARYFRVMTDIGGSREAMSEICDKIKGEGQDCILVLDTTREAQAVN